MLPLLERQPPWIVWTAGLGLAALLTFTAYAWMLVPHREQEDAALALAEQAAQQRAEAQTLRETLEGLHEELEDTRAALGEQPAELGDARQLNRQIAALIALAQEQGLEVLQLQPDEPVPGEDYDFIPLRLEAGATFGQHLTFIEVLHRTVPSVSVVGLDLESQLRAENPRPRGAYELVWFTAGEQPAVAAAPVAE